MHTIERLEKIQSQLTPRTAGDLLGWLFVAARHDDAIATAIIRWADYTPSTQIPCAWCISERGEKPQPGDSHGICQRHADECRRELATLNAARQ